MITREIAKKVVNIVDQGLSSGLGVNKPGQMCVEAAVCYAQGLPHGDKPTCVNDVLRTFKIALNDVQWSSRAARAQGMRKLAVLQLGTDKCFDDGDFVKRLSLFTIKTIVPIALRAAIAIHFNEGHKVALETAAVTCELAVTLPEAIKASDAASDAASAASAARYAVSAARYAARYAASAARYAASAARCAARYAASAASGAVSAARYAASAASAARCAASDKILNIMSEGASQILIDMGVPGVQFLDLL